VDITGYENGGDRAGNGVELGHSGDSRPVRQSVPEALHCGNGAVCRQGGDGLGYKRQSVLRAPGRCRIDPRAPGRLKIEMGVGVPQTGYDEGAFGVESAFAPRFQVRADLRDHAVADPPSRRGH